MADGKLSGDWFQTRWVFFFLFLKRVNYSFPCSFSFPGRFPLKISSCWAVTGHIFIRSNFRVIQAANHQSAVVPLVSLTFIKALSSSSHRHQCAPIESRVFNRKLINPFFAPTPNYLAPIWDNFTKMRPINLAPQIKSIFPIKSFGIESTGCQNDCFFSAIFSQFWVIFDRNVTKNFALQTQVNYSNQYDLNRMNQVSK